MHTNQIRSAASLIADIDPALAAAFIAQPFQRRNLAAAFVHGVRKSATFAHLADAIEDVLTHAIDATPAGALA
jgi:hypothetical protein